MAMTEKILQGLALLIVLLAVAFSGAWIWSAVVEAQYVYPKPETKSAFLTEYAPNKVVDAFRCGEYAYGWQFPGSSAAGRRFAEHHNWWKTYLLLKPGNEGAMMAALREDIRARLDRAGAHVMQPESESTDLGQGLQLRYTLGNTKGFVAVRPLKHVRPEDTRILPVPVGEDSIEFRMEISERWFRSPRDAGTGTWPASDDRNIRID